LARGTSALGKKKGLLLVFLHQVRGKKLARETSALGKEKGWLLAFLRQVRGKVGQENLSIR
jgi:hypothetical protein